MKPNTNNDTYKTQMKPPSSFGQFLQELQDWYQTGVEPKTATKNMCDCLNFKKARLQKNNITSRISIRPKGKTELCNSFSFSKSTTDHLYVNYFQYYQEIDQTIEYFKDEKRIFRTKTSANIYQNLCSAETDNYDQDNDTFSHDQLKTNTCFYKDLFSPFDKKMRRLKHVILIIFLALFLISSIYLSITMEDFSFYSLLFLLFIALFLAFPVYMITAMYTSFRIAKNTRDSEVPKIKFEITNALREYHPFITYEYVTEKAFSMAQLIMLSDDPDCNVFYKGGDISGMFSDIIDVNYRDIVKFDSIEQTGDNLQIKLRLFFTNTIYDGKNISLKNETISMKMERCLVQPITETTTSAVHYPHCEENYTSILDGWIVTNISR